MLCVLNTYEIIYRSKIYCKPLYCWIEVSSEGNYAWYRNNQWTKQAIDTKKNGVIKKDWNVVEGPYGPSETEVLYETLNLFKNKVIGKKALVIGSETPWVEAILLAVGAKHVTTLEYNRIKSTHPQVNNLSFHNLIITKTLEHSEN